MMMMMMMVMMMMVMMMLLLLPLLLLLCNTAASLQVQRSLLPSPPSPAVGAGPTGNTADSPSIGSAVRLSSACTDGGISFFLHARIAWGGGD